MEEDALCLRLWRDGMVAEEEDVDKKGVAREGSVCVCVGGQGA